MTQENSPFKFLDAYEKADVDVFFGRDKETKDLYNSLSGVKHLLVYGPSGSGKSSLVECGLRNKFSDTDWFALTIRKGQDINASIFLAINEALDNKIVLDTDTKLPVDPKIGIGEAIECLFEERYQPIYLLFDQFEELLISGEQDEKIKFFTNLNRLIRSQLPSRVLLIMREEFIGHFSEFEHLCPSIFQHRFRVEKMGRTQVQDVVKAMLEAPKYREHFDVENSAALAEKILTKLPDKRKEIELSHVQVFLGELWDRADSKKKEGKLPFFSADLLKKDDNLESVLESFLKKQMAELESTYGKGVPLELLAAMISEKFTKLQLSEADIKIELKVKNITSKKPIHDLLMAFEQRRILRALKVGDESQYEISHDTLALVVGQNLTEEMKMREKALDVYNTYAEQQGLFSQENVDYLRAFEPYLDYPISLGQRIKESEAKIKDDENERLQSQKKQLKRTRIFAGVISIIGIGAILASIVAVTRTLEAQKQKEIAEEQRVKADFALKDLDNSNIERTFELVRFSWIDLDRTGTSGFSTSSNFEHGSIDGYDCKTWLESGFRYLYCKVRGVVSFEKVQTISGINIFIEGGPHDEGLNLSDKRKFGHYNPEFLTWLDDFIIPGGMDDVAFNMVTQSVYETHIGPIARALYHSHEILFADPDTYQNFENRFRLVKEHYDSSYNQVMRFDNYPVKFEIIRASYSNALEEGRDVGWGSGEDLQEKFRWLSDYLEVDKNDDWYLANTAGGFWVRRSIDGTEAQIFQLVTKLLNTFEPEVLSKTIN